MKNNSVNKIIKTEDNSETLYSEQFKESYHSTKGAVEESLHVFVNTGFNFIEKDEISIFEVGFGTGLNALLTLIESEKKNKKVFYTAIEKFPVEEEVIKKLNYSQISGNNFNEYEKMHNVNAGENLKLSKYFHFRKILTDFTKFDFEQSYDLIYFDAFSFDTQPEMWSEEIFKKVYEATEIGGVLVTYSAKGIVKQNLRNAGFKVERLKGYKKRHCLRARKI